MAFNLVQIHLPTNQSKQYAQLYISPSPCSLYTIVCVCVCRGCVFCLFGFCFVFFAPLEFFLLPKQNLFLKKSSCLKILFKLQATVPIQEASLQFLRSLLCVFTVLYLFPRTLTTICPTYYLCFPSPGFYKVLEDRHHVFCSVTRESGRGKKGGWRGDEERKRKKWANSRRAWSKGKLSFKVFLVIQNLFAEDRFFEYLTHFLSRTI